MAKKKSVYDLMAKKKSVYDDYADCTEPAPGVFVDADPYGEGTGAVYIVDNKGEIVTWNYDEIVQDPSGFTAALVAVATAARCGASAVRKSMESYH